MGWFVDKPEPGRCEMEVPDQSGFHFCQCSRAIKYQMLRGTRVMGPDSPSVVDVCGTHRAYLKRRGWTETRSLASHSEQETQP